MGKLAPVTGPSSSHANMHTFVRAAAVGSVIVAIVFLLPHTGANIFKRSYFFSQADSGVSLREAQAALAAVGIDPTGGHASGTVGAQALQDALLQLPDLVEAVTLLKADYKQKHFVTYNPDYDLFIRNVKTALDAHQLPQRVFNEIFSDNNRVAHPSCEGSWMEFGVHTGGTITAASNWRTQYCSEKSPVVFGFDTFTGLPERWYGNFASGVFDLHGNLPPVPANVRLVKGLFNESLPLFLKELDASAPGGRLANLTYVHLDMDLYAGASDVFTILNDRISPGAIILFDELVNYPAYREHEMLAFWEWLGRTGRSVEVIGKLGPLPNRADAVELYPAVDLGGFQQSAAFIAL